MAPRWAVVFDFDGTLIRKSYISLFNVVEKGTLSGKHLEEHAALRAKYLPLAYNGIITREEEEEWMVKSVEIFIKARVNIGQIEKSVAAVRLRKGVAECLFALKARGIPVAVVSYGISQFIKAALKKNRVLYLVNKIYSLDLETNPATGLITGMRRETLVLPSGKGDASADFAEKVGVGKDRILAVGDSLVDSLLGGLKKNRFGVAENEKQLRHISNVMGSSAIISDFLPVTNWLLSRIDGDQKAPR